MNAKVTPLAVLIALAALAANPLRGFALERGMFGAHAAEVTGTRPLLVILIRDPDGLPDDEGRKYRNYYEDTVFGRSTAVPPERFELSTAGYYREVSNGKFAWSRAGFVSPLNASLKSKQAGEIARIAVEAAARDGGFNFKPLDLNRDGRITSDELAVLVVTNVPPSGRHAVDLSAEGRGIIVAGQDVTVAARIAIVGENDGFATLNRSLFELIVPEAVPLDGWPQKCFALNAGRSLMAAGNTSNPGFTIHLDPWNKMLAGWIEPRIFAFGKPGSAKLAAQHVAASEGEFKQPVLLFDPMKGPREFFLLEYRTHSALGFDQGPGSSGLVVWQVALNAANYPYPVPSDRPNCKGETLQVPSLFLRGAPNWQLGGSNAYGGGDGPFSLKWLDGTDTGVRVTAERHEPFEWRISIAWTAPSQ
jgi:hypothetical protein